MTQDPLIPAPAQARSQLAALLEDSRKAREEAIRLRQQLREGLKKVEVARQQLRELMRSNTIRRLVSEVGIDPAKHSSRLLLVSAWNQRGDGITPAGRGGSPPPPLETAPES